MKTTFVGSAVVLRAWGVLVLAVTVVYLIFYCTAAWLYRSYQPRPIPTPNEQAAAYEALAQRFVGDRYFQVEHPVAAPSTPEDRYVVPITVVREQVDRVARARHLDAEETRRVNQIINQLMAKSGTRSLHSETINVLRLNLALDELPQH